MERSLENRWIERYRAWAATRGAASVPLLEAVRRKALEAFERLEIPAKGSGHGDRYHYTDLRTAFAGEYRLATEAAPASATDSDSLPIQGHRIRLLNGGCGEKTLTRLSNGVIFGSLAAAARQEPSLVERYYDTLTDPQNVFSAMSALWMQDGVFVYVPTGVEEPLPFVIEDEVGDGGEALYCFARHLFVFERGSAARLVWDQRSRGEASTLKCGTREVSVGEDARIEMVELYRLSAQAVSVSGGYVRQARNSRFESLSASFNGALLRHDLTVMLDGCGAENRTDGVMLAGEAEKFDYTTDIRHHVSDCISSEQFKSIASGEGTAVFSGRIYVAPDAQRTNAYQQNNGLILNTGAHVYTKPQLEIYADDVKCSHGATVGQLDPEAIYYMRQRGISLQEARRLQMYGFVREVLGKTRIEGLAEVLEAMAVDKIDRL